MPVRNRHTWVWGLMFLMAGTMFLSGLDRLPFTDRDEGEYATVAQAMIERSDWVIPHVNGRPYYEKPALFFWLMALSFQTFGQNEAAGRLPSALAGLALVGLMAWFARRRGGDTLGLLSALMTSSSLLTVLLARVALLDMLLTLFTTASLFFFYEGYVAETDDGRRRFYLWAWLAMSLAFLTKGPVGAVVPLSAAFLTSTLNRNLFQTVKQARIPSGLLIFLAVAGPWYGLALMREGDNFWRGFFISQNVTRFSEVLLGHGAPIWFYIPVLILGVWPWSLMAAPALWRGLTGAKPAERKANPEASLNFFLGLWLAACLLIFSLSATKQPNYILPAVPAVVLLAAGWGRGLLAGGGKAKGVRVIFVLIVFVGLILAGSLMVLPPFLPSLLDQARIKINPDSSEYALPEQALALGWEVFTVGALLSGCLLAASISLFSGRRRAALIALAAAGVSLTAGLFHLTAPPVLDYLQTPARDLAFQVRQTIGREGRVASFGLYKPSMWYYTGRRIERIRTNEVRELDKFLASPERVMLLSRLSLLAVLKERPGFRLLRVAGGYILADNRAEGLRSAGGGRP
ncbi:MAG: glycosyltransferase family 39 protein [Thermodesulfobacteriota bacterium]